MFVYSIGIHRQSRFCLLISLGLVPFPFFVGFGYIGLVFWRTCGMQVSSLDFRLTLLHLRRVAQTSHVVVITTFSGRMHIAADQAASPHSE